MKRVRHLNDAEQAGYVQLPNVVLFDPELSEGAKLLYGALLFFAREKDSAWPGQETLGAMFSVSDRTVRARFRELEARGLVVTKRRGQGKVNVYRLRGTSGWTGTPLPFLTGEPLPGEEEREEEEREEQAAPVSSLFTASSEIDEAWSHYVEVMKPRRAIIDPDARRLLRAVFKVAELGEITMCIDRCAASDWHMKRGEHAGRRGPKRNRLSDIFKPKAGATQRERVDFWLEMDSPDPDPEAETNARVISQLRAQGLHDEADELENG